MFLNSDCVMGQAVKPGLSLRMHWVRYRTNPFGICGGQSGFGTDFSPSTWILPLHCHSVHLLPTFIHPQPTLCVIIKRLCRHAEKIRNVAT